MARLEPPTMEELTPEQKAIYDEVRRGRPQLVGPVRRAAAQSAARRRRQPGGRRDPQRGKLEKRLYELIVLIVARHAAASYAWAVHEPLAKDAGYQRRGDRGDPRRTQPAFAKPDERAIYDAVTALLKTNKISDAAYQALIKAVRLGADASRSSPAPGSTA